MNVLFEIDLLFVGLVSSLSLTEYSSGPNVFGNASLNGPFDGSSYHMKRTRTVFRLLKRSNIMDQ